MEKNLLKFPKHRQDTFILICLINYKYFDLINSNKNKFKGGAIQMQIQIEIFMIFFFKIFSLNCVMIFKEIHAQARFKLDLSIKKKPRQLLIKTQ